MTGKGCSISCVLFLSIIVGGCAAQMTGQRITGLHEGMSKAEVIKLLGNPDGFRRSGDYEALRYTNRLISGWSWDRADYYVILHKGRVVEYGAGEVRQRDPSIPKLNLVPAR